MIYGIGTDVCDIRRIEATLQRRGDRFAQKVLGSEEWQVFLYRRTRADRRGIAYLATRFSAKARSIGCMSGTRSLPLSQPVRRRI